MRVEVPTVERPRHRNASPPALAVAVVARNELVRRGIAGLLRVIAEVGPVRELAGPDELAQLGPAASFDLIIVAAAEADDLSRLDTSVARRTLVLVDPTTVGGLASPAFRHASGYLWQPTLSAASLREAVRRGSEGSLPAPVELTQALMSRMDDAIRRPRPVSLTGREREALELLVKGLSNKQIAKRLAISSHGAKRLVTSIMLKLDAPNRTVAAVIAIRAGLVDEDR